MMRARIGRLTVILVVTGGLLVMAPIALGTDLSVEEGFHPAVTLHQGDSGPTIVRLQWRLAELGAYSGPISGEFDTQTAYAVRAFHAYVGRPPTYSLHPADWPLLDSGPADPGIPDRWNEPDRVEADIGRQLLFVVRDGQIAAIVPISSGGGYSYFSDLRDRRVLARTPHGDFTLRWHQLGWSCLPTCVYKYWGFTDIYGIHGYPQVPNYPASHGCIRVTTWDARRIEPLMYVGMPLHVWDSRPEVPPSPLDLIG
jgi:lipoprotein-anchoring transpeptidase ErfK/SrfK